MTGPLVSVIIPTAGRPEGLADAVASVLGQTVSDLEVVVVVDGGDDPGAPDASFASDPRVRTVVRAARGGASAARNTGIGAARGRFVTFLDDDDVYTPRRLEIGLQATRSAPIGLCWRDPDGGPGAGVPWRRALEGCVHDVILDSPIPHVGQATMERSMVPSFDERFRVSEDIEWWLRVSALAPVATVPEVGYVLRGHTGERQTGRLDDRAACRLLLLSEHRDYFRTHPRAAAYHWKRLGGIAEQVGDRALARAAFRRSLRSRPTPSAALHLLGSVRRSARSLGLDVRVGR